MKYIMKKGSFKYFKLYASYMMSVNFFFCISYQRIALHTCTGIGYDILSKLFSTLLAYLLIRLCPKKFSNLK